MSLSRAILLPVGFSVLALAGCSGSGGSSGAAHVRCGGTESFCLVSCDLGCGGAGCAVTEVAENQRIQFVFNQDLAPSSIDVSSFSLRTASGEAPLGDTIVDGPRVTFVPLVSVSGGVSSFGFRRNESYIVTLLGGSQRAIRSVAGDILPQSFTCTITASGGIIDADNARPRATLIAPTNIVAAPANSTIVLRFSELIDSTPFQAPISPSTPIHYVLRQTRIPTGTTERICNPDSEAIQLEGLPVVSIEQVNGRLVTVISLRPTISLPGLGCVEVQVTADVRDLAGKGAEEATFRFITEAGVIVDTPLVEDFASPARRDPDVSGGDWLNGAHPAVVGGDGRHGSFNYQNGVDQGNNNYLWSTENQVIPGTQTFSGQNETVITGEFFFSDLVIPANVTVKFQGSNPLKLHVRGKVEVRGVLDASAPAMTLFNSRNQAPSVTPEQGVAGQAGGSGGPGGARGGAGGNRILLNPDASGNNGTVVTTGSNGNNGFDLAVPAGHAYAAQAVGTGGLGSPFFPANPGALTHIPIPGNGLYSAVVGTGGGGGGFSLPGGNAVAIGSIGFTLPATNAQGGIQFNILPLPTPTTSSLAHFLVGGAGGGGGGSHPFAGPTQVTVPQFKRDWYRAGAGGSGGGGAMMMRVGGDLLIATSGTVRANGGPGVLINGDNPGTPINPDQVTTTGVPQTNSWGAPCPGGGGSGGTLLLQSHGTITVDGPVSTAGGAASHIASLAFTSLMPPPNTFGDVRGGDGAPGFYRLESRTAVVVHSLANVPAYNPGANNGTLIDRDTQSGSRALWRSSGAAFPPQWVRYEMQVDLDGDGVVDQLFSDDPSVPNSVGPANDPLGPVRVRFQGARVSPSGVPTPGTIRPWRDFVSDAGGTGINSDAATGFRFEMIFNSAQFPNTVVKRLTVIVRS